MGPKFLSSLISLLVWEGIVVYFSQPILLSPVSGPFSEKVWLCRKCHLSPRLPRDHLLYRTYSSEVAILSFWTSLLTGCSCLLTDHEHVDSCWVYSKVYVCHLKWHAYMSGVLAVLSPWGWPGAYRRLCCLTCKERMVASTQDFQASILYPSLLYVAWKVQAIGVERAALLLVPLCSPFSTWALAVTSGGVDSMRRADCYSRKTSTTARFKDWARHPASEATICKKVLRVQPAPRAPVRIERGGREGAVSVQCGQDWGFLAQPCSAWEDVQQTWLLCAVERSCCHQSSCFPPGWSQSMNSDSLAWVMTESVFVSSIARWASLIWRSKIWNASESAAFECWQDATSGKSHTMKLSHVENYIKALYKVTFRLCA